MARRLRLPWQSYNQIERGTYPTALVDPASWQDLCDEIRIHLDASDDLIARLKERW